MVADVGPNVHDPAGELLLSDEFEERHLIQRPPPDACRNLARHRAPGELMELVPMPLHLNRKEVPGVHRVQPFLNLLLGDPSQLAPPASC